jgi:hypothetical protein
MQKSEPEINSISSILRLRDAVEAGTFKLRPEQLVSFDAAVSVIRSSCPTTGQRPTGSRSAPTLREQKPQQRNKPGIPNDIRAVHATRQQKSSDNDLPRGDHIVLAGSQVSFRTTIPINKDPAVAADLAWEMVGKAKSLTVNGVLFGLPPYIQGEEKLGLIWAILTSPLNDEKRVLGVGSSNAIKSLQVTGGLADAGRNHDLLPTWSLFKREIAFTANILPKWTGLGVKEVEREAALAFSAIDAFRVPVVDEKGKEEASEFLPDQSITLDDDPPPVEYTWVCRKCKDTTTTFVNDDPRVDELCENCAVALWLVAQQKAKFSSPVPPTKLVPVSPQSRLALEGELEL